MEGVPSVYRWWRQHVPLTRRCTFTRLGGDKFRKTAIVYGDSLGRGNLLRVYFKNSGGQCDDFRFRHSYISCLEAWTSVLDSSIFCRWVVIEDPNITIQSPYLFITSDFSNSLIEITQQISANWKWTICFTQNCRKLPISANSCIMPAAAQRFIRPLQISTWFKIIPSDCRTLYKINEFEFQFAAINSADI